MKKTLFPIKYINEIEVRLNKLKNTPYIGIKEVDDCLDKDIENLKSILKEYVEQEILSNPKINEVIKRQRARVYS